MKCHCCPMEATETVMIDGQEYGLCKKCAKPYENLEEALKKVFELLKGAEQSA